MPGDSFVVTPYEVKGKIDYVRLRERFGTQELDDKLKREIRRLAGGELHPLIERGVYFSHRDLAQLLSEFGKGNRFFLYSGRGPSGPLHTSHMIPFDLCQWLQKKLGLLMLVQITDDEKFWFRPRLDRKETYRWGLENLLDIIAVGFDPKRTRVFFDTRSIAGMYSLAVDVAKKVPYSTVKAVFGFAPSTNIGLVFYTALQTVPCFYPSWRLGRPVPCLIPCGIDQDPHFRITRDLAGSLGYPKPALLHSQMVPSLEGEAKMSTTGESKEAAIFLDDTPVDVERKIGRALTGGRATVEEQRRLGATPEICSVWALWRTTFAPRADLFEQITRDCRSGALLCGDCKQNLVGSVNKFLESHRARREQARGVAESLILEGTPGETSASGAPPLPEP